MACCWHSLLPGLFLGWLLSWLFDEFLRRGSGSSDGRIVTSVAPPMATPASSFAPAFTVASAAAAFGLTRLKSANGYDNVEIIQGIGPKINEVPHKARVHTFAQLG